MTIIYVELEPENISFNIFSDLDSLSEDSGLEHGRYIALSGKPNFSGTYRYTDVNFNKGGTSISIPTLASMTIRERDSNPEVIGRLTYIESYSDDELGIKEPDQLSAEIEYPSKHFEKVWNLVCNVDIEKLKATIAIKAPKTDISGHEAIFDIRKTDTWPINALYINRHEKQA